MFQTLPKKHCQRHCFMSCDTAKDPSFVQLIPFPPAGVCACFESLQQARHREDRLRLIFAIFDVDNDGTVSAEDLELMVRQLAGQSLS